MRRCLSIVLGVLLLAGCASSPAPRFHALEARALPGTQVLSLTMVVEAVGLPARVDRRQLVFGTGQVQIDEFERWAAPLREELGQVLALNLSRRLGAKQVSAWPQALIAEPDLRIYVDLARFESVPGERALIEASWAVRDDKGRMLANGRDVYQAVPTDLAVTSLVIAHDRTLVALSADIAEAIRQARPHKL